MTSDVSGLAAADVRYQGDGERQVRFLPETLDGAWLAIIQQNKIFRFKISRWRTAASSYRAGDRDQIHIYTDVWSLLSRKDASGNQNQ